MMADEDMVEEAVATRPAGTWVKAILLGSAILVSGMVIGGVLTYGVLERERAGEPFPQEHSPARIVEHLQHDLNLTNDQATAVLEIFTRHHERMEMVRMKVRPDIEAEMEAARKEVDAILTEQQRPAWSKRCTEMRERFQSHRSEGGGKAHSGAAPEEMDGKTK